MTRPILYFVNADGSGHTRRAEAILPHLKTPAIVLTEAPELFRDVPSHHTVHPLPRLRAAHDTQLADDVLHIPYGRDGSYVDRVHTTCDLSRRYQCSLAVIDVCVETAMTMRLCGIPYLYMRMNGKRNDAAHLQCYQAAAGLLASYPEALEEKWVPRWMRSKTRYVGGIAALPKATWQPHQISEKPYVVVMRGKGDSTLTALEIRKAAQVVKKYYWIGIGFTTSEKGENYQIFEYVDEPMPYLEQAEVVVTNTGNNSVLEVGRYSKPFITLPEVRFFDEQLAKAKRLADLNLAVVLKRWPTNTFQWHDALRRSQKLKTHRWVEILSDDGAQQAANYIEQQLAIASHVQ